MYQTHVDCGYARLRFPIGAAGSHVRCAAMYVSQEFTQARKDIFGLSSALFTSDWKNFPIPCILIPPVSSSIQNGRKAARSSKSHARDSSLALSGFSKLSTRHCLRNFNSEISVPLSLSLSFSLCVNTLVGSAKASEYSEAEAGLNVSSKLNKNNSRSGRIGATITSRACLSAKPVHDTIAFLSRRSVHRSGSSTLLAARGEYARGRPSGFNLDRRAVTGAVE